MSEITLHTGCAGDHTVIKIQWYDEDNVQQRTLVEISVKDQDKPRTLLVAVDGKTVAEIVREKNRSPVQKLAQVLAEADWTLAQVSGSLLSAKNLTGDVLRQELEITQARVDLLRTRLEKLE